MNSLKDNTKATKTCQLKRMFGNPVYSRACHAGWPAAPFWHLHSWDSCVT